MSYIKKFSEYISSSHINEEKSVQNTVKNISRHLAFDKDIIKYLNTPRSKREIGWRDLLLKKLHGSEQDYITYITKNMVQNLNNKITGPVSINFKDDDKDNETSVTLDTRLKGMTIDDKIDDINNRLENVENLLGIDPDDEDTLTKAREKASELGFDVLEREDEEIKEKE